MMNRREELHGALARWASRFMTDAVLKSHFVRPLGISLKGEGGGFWEISSVKPPHELTPEDSRAELVIELSTADFLSLERGELNPQEAYLEGRLRLLGDADLALWLYPLFDPGGLEGRAS